MALDKNTLKTKIQTAFENVQKTKIPADPDKVKVTQNEILINLAEELANAIDAYVRSGDVKNVKVNVKLDVMNLSEPKIKIGTVDGTASQVENEYGNIE